MNSVYLLLTDSELVCLHAAVTNHNTTLKLLNRDNLQDRLLSEVGSGVISRERLDEIKKASETLDEKVRDAFVECLEHRDSTQKG